MYSPFFEESTSFISFARNYDFKYVIKIRDHAWECIHILKNFLLVSFRIRCFCLPHSELFHFSLVNITFATIILVLQLFGTINISNNICTLNTIDKTFKKKEEITRNKLSINIKNEKTLPTLCKCSRHTKLKWKYCWCTWLKHYSIAYCTVHRRRVCCIMWDRSIEWEIIEWNFFKWDGAWSIKVFFL